MFHLAGHRDGILPQRPEGAGSVALPVPLRLAQYRHVGVGVEQLQAVEGQEAEVDGLRDVEHPGQGGTG